MFKKILVPVDFSEPARKAYETAVPLARESGGEIVLLYVGDIPETPDALDPSMREVEKMYEDILKARLTNARALLQRWMEDYQHQGVTVSDCLAEGVPFERIIEVASEIGADLIVLGTHGRHGLRRIIIGSTTERVVRLAPVPVLTVRADGVKSA
jgi:nucleotide-binding universal stress UspA family protein